jgi:hypothetical protein
VEREREREKEERDRERARLAAAAEAQAEATHATEGEVQVPGRWLVIDGENPYDFAAFAFAVGHSKLCSSARSSTMQR